MRGLADGLPPALHASSKFTAQGLRAGAAIQLRHAISVSGTRLKRGAPPALTPLPSFTPPSVVLTQTGVLPLLKRAVDIGRALASANSGPDAEAAAGFAAATQRVVDALDQHRARAVQYGVTPLFNLGHGPLAGVLEKQATKDGCVPGQPVVTNGGAGIRLTIPKVQYRRRVEPTGAKAKAGRVFNWDPVGSRWLRPAGKRAQNGAGLRTLKRDRRDWRCGTPGAYHVEGVPPGWQPWWDNASCVCLDPGVLLLLCSPEGLAVTKAQWYENRRAWIDYQPRPKDVRAAEAQMARDGGFSQAPGLLPFMGYLQAFWKAYPTLEAFHASRTQGGAREHKLDKLRSALDRTLHALAPRPQGTMGGGGAAGGGSGLVWRGPCVYGRGGGHTPVPSEIPL